MEQILWAVKSAPVADVNEWAVLVAMAEAADQDGTNSFLSVTTISNRTRLAERTVQRRIATLEERGLLRRGDQSAARMIPAARRPVVYDLQVPYSFFRNEKSYDGGEVELSVNVWRAGRGRAPLTPADRPDLTIAPDKSERADKGIKRPRNDGVTTSHPGDDEAGVTTSQPRGDYESPVGVTDSHPTLPSNPLHNPPRSAARSAATATPMETSSSSITSGDARDDDAAAANRPIGARAGATRGTPDQILESMMLNADEAARFRAWLVDATSATNPDGLIVTLAASERLSERLSQWRASEAQQAVPAATTPAQGRLQWCGLCDETTRIMTEWDGVRETVRRCPICNLNAAVTPSTGAVAAIAAEAARVDRTPGQGRAAFEAARAALPAGTGRRTTTIGTVLDVATVRVTQDGAL